MLMERQVHSSEIDLQLGRVLLLLQDLLLLLNSESSFLLFKLFLGQTSLSFSFFVFLFFLFINFLLILARNRFRFAFVGKFLEFFTAFFPLESFIFFGSTSCTDNQNTIIRTIRQIHFRLKLEHITVSGCDLKWNPHFVFINIAS